jgi:hypothetical protein
MHFDSTDSPMFINEQIHKNAQATTVLLALQHKPPIATHLQQHMVLCIVRN